VLAMGNRRGFPWCHKSRCTAGRSGVWLEKHDAPALPFPWAINGCTQREYPMRVMTSRRCDSRGLSEREAGGVIESEG
jgi:hypothetical protein